MDSAQYFSLTGDEKLQEVLGRLRFMAKIKLGEKINVRDLFVRDNDSLLQRFLRTCKNVGTYMSSTEIVESKETTLEFIRVTVNDAITLISLYSKNPNNRFQQSLASIIVKDLEGAKIGIRNLITTYKSDRRFISSAEATIQTLEARIDSLKERGVAQGISEDSFMPQLDSSDSE